MDKEFLSLVEKHGPNKVLDHLYDKLTNAENPIMLNHYELIGGINRSNRSDMKRREHFTQSYIKHMNKHALEFLKEYFTTHWSNEEIAKALSQSSKYDYWEPDLLKDLQ